MSKVDYVYKSYVLSNHKDLIDYVRKCSRYQYVLNQFNDNGVILKLPNSDKKLMTITDLRMDYADKGEQRLLREAIKINSASYKRVKRLQSRINAIISQNESVFLTITFTDKALENTNALTRRKAVSRYLKSFNAPYVANIDFGVSENHTKREHYHAVIGSQKVNYLEWPYGSVNGKRIHVKNDKALSKYVSKLSNHAIKEQARRCSLLYSR